MGDLVSVLLPVAPVKFGDIDLQIRGVQAVDIDIYAIRIGTRRIERFDTANFAECMLGDTCIEGVGSE